jgi:hypothetical protein
MVRQAHHERNQTLAVRPELVEGLVQRFLECFFKVCQPTRISRHELPENWRTIRGKLAACRVISPAYLKADDIDERGL